MCGVGLERQIAELVDDQQLGPRQDRQLLFQRTFLMSLGKHGDQRRGGNELGAIILPDRLAPERNRQMRFACAWRPEQKGRVASGLSARLYSLQVKGIWSL